MLLMVRCMLVQVIVSVAEHHSNLVPWQMACQSTGATLRAVPLTKETQEIDMQVLQILLHCSAWYLMNCISPHELQFIDCFRGIETLCPCTGLQGYAVREDKDCRIGARVKYAGVSP